MGLAGPRRGDHAVSQRGRSVRGRSAPRVDIAAPVGAAVVAARSGVVRFAGAAGHSGLTLGIRTADGRYDTSYLHLSAVSVRQGQRVAAGQRLGSAGTSGRPSSPRPHLHFGVRDAGSRHAYHDPLRFLSRPARPRPPHRPPVPVGAPARPSPAPLAEPHHGPRHEPRRGGRREARRAVRRGLFRFPGRGPRRGFTGAVGISGGLRHGAASRLASRRPARPTLQRGRRRRRPRRRTAAGPAAGGGGTRPRPGSGLPRPPARGGPDRHEGRPRRGPPARPRTTARAARCCGR